MQSISDESRDYSFSDLEIDQRFIRCEYEMFISFVSWIVYAALCIGVSYYMGMGGVENMTYTYGIPTWYFWGILVPTGVFFVFVCYCTMFVFQDMDLFDSPSKN